MFSENVILTCTGMECWMTAAGWGDGAGGALRFLGGA